jgi:PhnB protein
MLVNPYFMFNGNCREAVHYYAEVFNAEQPQIMTYGESHSGDDFPMPPEASELVMHAQLIICDTRIMFADIFPDSPFQQGSQLQIALVHNNADEMKVYFDRLKADGTIGMELQETSWSKHFGMLTDRFGISWQFSHEA